MHILFVLFLLIFSPVAVMAQDEAKPAIEVSADDALQWDRANQKFTANGNALISQGTDSISAPQIIAQYTDINGDITIQSVTANDNATLKQDDTKLSANIIKAEFENGVLSTVTANDTVKLVTPKETLSGDKAEYDAINRKIIVTGNVKIKQADNILTGNKAEFNLNKNVSRLTADGGRVKAVFQ